MTVADLKDRASLTGLAAFGDDWTVDSWSVAPGRLELIGNHIDYNGGPVLAGAIDRYLVVAAGAIDDAFSIEIFAGDVASQTEAFRPHELGDWHATSLDHGPAVYVKGVIAALIAREIPIRTGVGLAVAGNIPPGFGMSSSAALCLAAILALTIDEIPSLEMVAIAREAEHRVGAMVGAMDQSASLAGGVIEFDGRDNSFSTITPDLGEYVFAVADSGVTRSLRTSAYGTRVQETSEAREKIATAYDLDLPNLAAIEPLWDRILPTLAHHLSPTLLARTRHVVTETRRVQKAAKAVSNSDWQEFGRLMNASGQSSAVDYDISDPVVEELVAHLRDQPGVLGARMMGGGNGGPALTLLHRNAAADVQASQEVFYDLHPMTQPELAFQLCTFGPGVHRDPI